MGEAALGVVDWRRFSRGTEENKRTVIAKFVVMKALTTKNTVFRDVTSSTAVILRKYTGEGNGVFFRNADKILPNCTLSYIPI